MSVMGLLTCTGGGRGVRPDPVPALELGPANQHEARVAGEGPGPAGLVTGAGDPAIGQLGGGALG